MSTRSKIVEKGQIKNFMKSIQIICPKEALDVSLSQLLVSTSFKVKDSTVNILNVKIKLLESVWGSYTTYHLERRERLTRS